MRKMRQFTLEEFDDEMKTLLRGFYNNLTSLNMSPQSFPEWCESFLAWSEVGTDMQEDTWGYEELDNETPQ